MVSDNILLIGAIYGGVVLAVFWLAMIIWAYRDMRARSRDSLAQMFVALSVALLNVPGLFIYIMLRPRETLVEAYERSLEEEALLQEIEEKPVCPGCGQRVQDSWQACPNCHTRLKKPCVVCNHLLDLAWELCPHCANAQPTYLPEDQAIQRSRHVQHTPPARQPDLPEIPEKWLNPGTAPSRVDTPNFIDDGY